MARGRMISKAISLDEKVKRHTIPINLRLKVIKRDDCRCQYCGKEGELIMRYGKPTVVENPKRLELFKMDYYNGSDVISFHFDHITPVSAGGENTEDNIVLSCQHCNESKGARYG